MNWVLSGYVAIYEGKCLEILKEDAKDLYTAKLKAIKYWNIPKSKQSLLSVEPGYDELDI